MLHAELTHKGPSVDCTQCRHRSGVGLRDLSPRELLLVSSNRLAHEKAWSGDMLVEQGQAAKRLFTLYSGVAVKYRALPHGSRQLLAILLPGDLVGVDALFHQPAFASVQAATDVTCCVFNPNRWADMLDSPALLRRICEIQYQDQRRTEDWLAIVGAGSAPMRAAHFLVDLYDRLRIRRLAREGEFTLPLTRQQFADALGMTSVHLHRVMRSLKADGLVDQLRRRIVILDMKRLRDLAGLPQPDLALRPFL